MDSGGFTEFQGYNFLSIPTMSDEEKKGGGFKFKDSRRFDSDGNDKADKKTPSEKTAPEIAATGASPDEDAVEAASKLPRAGQSSVSRDIDFSSFIISLGTQALMQLGAMKPPEGMQVPIDKVGAKQTIDIISMLKEKTEGNLDEGEVKLLEEILHSLRISFVKIAAG